MRKVGTIRHEPIIDPETGAEIECAWIEPAEYPGPGERLARAYGDYWILSADEVFEDIPAPETLPVPV